MTLSRIRPAGLYEVEGSVITFMTQPRGRFRSAFGLGLRRFSV